MKEAYSKVQCDLYVHLRAIDNPTSIVFTRHSGNTTFDAILISAINHYFAA